MGETFIEMANNYYINYLKIFPALYAMFMYGKLFKKIEILMLFLYVPFKYKIEIENRKNI